MKGDDGIKLKPSFITTYEEILEEYEVYRENGFRLARIIINNMKTHYFIRSDGLLFTDRFTSKGKLIQRKVNLNNSENKYVLYHMSVNNASYTKSAHRLVAEAFIPNYYNKPEVNHKDGNKLNNDISNLEWFTSKENMEHAVENNLYVTLYGEDRPNTKITEKQAHDICKLLEDNKLSIKEIAETIGCTRYIIENIKAGLSWINVSCNYNISNHTVYASSNNGHMRLTENEIKDICSKLESGKFSVKEISELYDVGYSTISDIKLGKTWTYISKNFDFSNCLYNRKY